MHTLLFLFCPALHLGGLKRKAMKEQVTMSRAVAPMLFPCEPGAFLDSIRQIVREETARRQEQPTLQSQSYSTPGMAAKPLYKLAEVCAMFQVTKPAIYDWIRHGKFKPFKVRSRVFFYGRTSRRCYPRTKTIFFQIQRCYVIVRPTTSCFAMLS